MAIVGTGGMANVHATRFQELHGSKVVAACDIDPVRAAEFAQKHGIPRHYGSLDLLLRDGAFDAVAVVTPDSSHGAVSMACLKAGKHVLCEKPIAPDAREGRRMLAAARRAGVIHAINFSYRGWPCIQGARAAIEAGRIGEVRHVEASYLQAWLASKIWGDWRTNPAWLWRLSTKHGSGGVLGDVGVHIVDYATFPVGAVKEVYCRLATFPKAPGDRIGPYVLDANDSATINVEFADGALGVIHTSRWVGGHANRLALTVAGTKGTISMDSAISTTEYRICAGKDLDRCEWRTVECKPVPDLYERFVRAVRSGTPATPDFQRGVEVQTILDACFESDRKRRPVRIAASRN